MAVTYNRLCSQLTTNMVQYGRTFLESFLTLTGPDDTIFINFVINGSSDTTLNKELTSVLSMHLKTIVRKCKIIYNNLNKFSSNYIHEYTLKTQSNNPLLPPA